MMLFFRRTEVVGAISALLFLLLLLGNPCFAGPSLEIPISLEIASNDQEEKPESIETLQKALKANPEDEVARLNLGMAYYNSQAYLSAVKEFKEVLVQNPANSSALIFLGLSFQELGHNQEAIANFEKARELDPSFNQLALFNIGKSQIQLGKMSEAAETLTQAINLDSTSDIADGAEDLLKSMAKKEDDKRWTVWAGIGFEYDDNVTVNELDLTSQEDDFAYIFEFSGAYKLLQDSKYELEAGYNFYQSIYDDLSIFDLQSHIFSLSGSHELHDFNLGAFAFYNRTFLGGDKFLEIHSFSPNVGYSIFDTWYATFTYSYNDTNFFNDPDRDSQNHGFSLDNYIFFMDNKAFLLLGYRFENEITTGDEFDFLGQFLTAGVQAPLAFLDLETKVKFTYKYFFKDYRNLTASIGEERKDFRHSLQLGITQPVYKALLAKLDYQFIDSVSNLASSDFRENIVTLSLGVYF